MTARTIAGLPPGAFTVLVGQDDEALFDALCCCRADGMVIITSATKGIGASDLAARLRAAGGTAVGLTDLFDSLHPTRIPAGMASPRAAGVPAVAPTHHVYVLGCCDPGQLPVLHDGQVARLSEHPEAERMKGALTAGQLWTLDDEAAWVPAAVERRGR